MTHTCLFWIVCEVFFPVAVGTEQITLGYLGTDLLGKLGVETGWITLGCLKCNLKKFFAWVPVMKIQGSKALIIPTGATLPPGPLLPPLGPGTVPFPNPLVVTVLTLGPG